MALKDSFLDKEKVDELNAKIYEQGYIDRADLMNFLTYIDTSDGKLIVGEVKGWLQGLHDDPKYDKIVFPKGDIEAILGDLDSFGKVSTETILQFKEESNKTLPIT
jgi:hypothetical protein